MGRRTLLTPACQDRIVRALRLGATYEIAAKHGGIGVTTLYSWFERGRQGREPYKEFLQACQSAVGDNAVLCLEEVRKAAARGNWQAAAWLLERRHGYTKTERVEHAGEAKPATVADVEGLSAELADELAKVRQLTGA